ncbi:MAG: hypothetical protein ACR2PL_03450, partial [Dehalococcoidia bacterium]
DHGPGTKCVMLTDDYQLRTRPDVIGLKVAANGLGRAVVRDYKAKNEVVNPAFDTGIISRALWVLAELRDSRCRWFLGDSGISVDNSVVDLETVNLLHGDSREFLVQVTLTEQQLFEERERLIGTMTAMQKVLATQDLGEIAASTGSFCVRWCPFLAYCWPGMDYVGKYHGDDVLHERLIEM